MVWNSKGWWESGGGGTETSKCVCVFSVVNRGEGHSWVFPQSAFILPSDQSSVTASARKTLTKTQKCVCVCVLLKTSWISHILYGGKGTSGVYVTPAVMWGQTGDTQRPSVLALVGRGMPVPGVNTPPPPAVVPSAAWRRATLSSRRSPRRRPSFLVDITSSAHFLFVSSHFSGSCWNIPDISSALIGALWKSDTLVGRLERWCLWVRA